MTDILTDDQIKTLLAEPKTLPEELSGLTLPLRSVKLGHKEAQYDITGSSGNDFRIITRQNNFNAFDFSVILAYLPPMTNQVFRLRRYNGKSHEHTNRIESEKFYGFHIHIATERYQRESEIEDGYAESTTRYGDLKGAIQCLISDCGFLFPDRRQMSLF